MPELPELLVRALEGVHFGLNHPIFTLSGTQVSAATLLTVFVVLVVAFRLSGLAQAALRRLAQARGLRDEAQLGAGLRLLHYIFIGIGFLVGLQTVGIQLDALLTAGAVFAVGFGLAMQGIAQNFVSGVILLVEQSIRPGDVVEVDGRLLRVEEMSVRATIARGLDGGRIIVPNGALAQGSVRNLTLKGRGTRITATVGVPYDTDPVVARGVLEAAAAAVPGRAADPAPAAQLVSFGDSALVFDVHLWITEAWDLPAVRAALHEALWRGLKDAGIPIPFPQRDLHLGAASLRALAALAAPPPADGGRP
jgi:potassium efflux system protein